MLYAIVGEDAPGSLEKRLAARGEHLVRVQSLKDSGNLILAGPFPAIDASDPGDAGFAGSLIVAEFPSLKDAENWVAQDPYVRDGVWNKTSVRPFKKVLP